MTDYVDLQDWEGVNNLASARMDRRYLLRLLGVSTASIAGLSVLAACGGSPSLTRTPTATTTAMLSVQTGEKRKLPSYFLGFNAVPIQGATWSNANLVKAAQELSVETLRYPGGTIANYWDWNKGWFLPTAQPGFLKLSPLPYRLQDLQTVVQATGANPIYVLNMLTSTLDYQLEMLRSAKSMGLPVQLIELGNEFYLPQKDNVAKFPTGQDYAKLCNMWIPAIQSEFPGAKIGIVGQSPDPNIPSDSRRLSWNQDVLQTVQGASALTLHPYVTFKFVQQNQHKAHAVADQIEMNTLSAPGGKSKVISTFFARWQQIRKIIQPLPQAMEVWHTEYNLEDTIGRIHTSWLSGVFVATMVLTFLQNVNTTLTCFYELTGVNGKEVFFLNAGGFSQLANAPATTPNTFSASGLVLSLLGDTVKGMTSAQKMVFSPNLLVSDGDVPYPALTGWIFSDGSRHQAVVVNSSQNTFILPEGAVPGATQFQQLAADPLMPVTGSNSLTPQVGSMQGQLTLPPYSVIQIK